MPSATRSDLMSCTRITTEDLGQAVRNMARTKDLEHVYREAAVIAAIRENRINLEKSHAAG